MRRSTSSRRAEFGGLDMAVIPLDPKRMVKVTPARMRRAYRPLATEIGLVACYWNNLHARLSLIYANLLAPGKIVTAEQIGPLASWNTLESDRSQREMLRAVAAAALKADKRAKDSIDWIINKANELSDKRNDLVHSPYILTLRGGELSVTPNVFFEHRRAKKLGPNPQQQAKDCAYSISVLISYASDVDACMKFPELPWPQRPQLQPPTPSQTHRARNRRTGAKSPPPPPASSPP